MPKPALHSLLISKDDALRLRNKFIRSPFHETNLISLVTNLKNKRECQPYWLIFCKMGKPKKSLAK
jgi:hypothetical protein